MKTKSAKELVAEAAAAIETKSAAEAVGLIDDSNVVFVDVRETDERRNTGAIRRAVHAPRGFLEFYADPQSPTHKKELGNGKKLILYCGSGNRSALAAKTLKSMGIVDVAHVAGGFPALREAGAEVDEVE